MAWYYKILGVTEPVWTTSATPGVPGGYEVLAPEIAAGTTNPSSSYRFKIDCTDKKTQYRAGGVGCGCALLTGIAIGLWLGLSKMSTVVFDMGGIVPPDTNFTKGERLALVPNPSVTLRNTEGVYGFNFGVNFNTAGAVNCSLYSGEVEHPVVDSISYPFSFPSNDDSARSDAEGFLGGLTYACEGAVPEAFAVSIFGAVNIASGGCGSSPDSGRSLRMCDPSTAPDLKDSNAEMSTTIFYRPDLNTTESTSELDIA